MPNSGGNLIDLDTAGYSATASQIMSIISTCAGRLVLRGRLLEAVCCVLPVEPLIRNSSTDGPNRFFLEDIKASFDWHEAVAKIFRHRKSNHSPERWIEPMARTLVANFNLTDWKPTSAECVGHLLTLLAFAKQLIEAYAMQDDDTSQVPKHFSSQSLHLPVSPGFPSIDDISPDHVSDTNDTTRMINWGQRRAYFRKQRVFSTTAGYMGIGPPLMEEKDVLRLVYGAITPFLLRPTGDGKVYRLVHGLMNGEGLEMGEEQDITLV